MSERDRVVEEAVRALESTFGAKSASLTPRTSGNSGFAAARPADDAIRCERVRTVLRALDDLPGMSVWLQREQPQVWAHCCNLLRHVDADWFGSLAGFEAALDRFATAFRDARELYRMHLQKPAQGVLESLQAVNWEKER